MAAAMARSISGCPTFTCSAHHQELAKIRVQKGSDDWVQFPVVVLRPLGEVHDHR
jgi:hypothetical protein